MFQNGIYFVTLGTQGLPWAVYCNQESLGGGTLAGFLIFFTLIKSLRVFDMRYSGWMLVNAKQTATFKTWNAAYQQSCGVDALVSPDCKSAVPTGDEVYFGDFMWKFKGSDNIFGTRSLSLDSSLVPIPSQVSHAASLVIRCCSYIRQLRCGLFGVFER